MSSCAESSARSRAQHRSGPVEGLRRLEYRGYDSAGVAVHGRRRHRARAQHRARRRARRAGRETAICRRHRHRAHALGHARRAGDRQRASASSRSDEIARACTTASSRTTRSCAHELNGAGLRLREPDRHRSHRAPDRTAIYDGDLLEAVQRAVHAPARRLRDRRVLRRDEPHRVVGARAGLAARGRASGKRRELPRVRRDGARRRHRPHHLSRGRRRRRSAARRRTGSSIATASAVERERAHGAGAQRRGRARARTATTCRRRSSSSRARSPTRSKRVAGDRARALRRRARDASSRRSTRVLILACGTSYYAGADGEVLARDRSPKIPTQVEIASEYRYRDSVPNPNDAGRRRSRSRARPPTRWPR